VHIRITKKKLRLIYLGGVVSLCALFFALFSFVYANFVAIEYNSAGAVASSTEERKEILSPVPTLDIALYDKLYNSLANYPSTTPSTTVRIWPVKTPYPKAGAILPFRRIVAYYGNFYSKQMGALGKYPTEEMITRLNGEVAKWTAADPTTPAIPAINYIAITAQEAAGKDGKYRLRMPHDQIDHAVALAKRVNGIVILDVQVGLSTLQIELPLLEKYLKMPEVHLGIDPEFSMKNKEKPGTVIGKFTAADVNYTANYLAKLVRDNNLPPKVLVIHRFTKGMITGYKQITPLPEVQIVMDMDGWGPPAKKKGTYQQIIFPEPVQFTGFKLFYVNDLKAPSTRLLTPAEILQLNPKPVFIQYQ